MATHPFMMLQFLTDGQYDVRSGNYITGAGVPRVYYASDNLQSESMKGLTPDDLIDIAVLRKIHFHGAKQEGVVFHLIGALSEFGKLGIVCIAETLQRAQELHTNVKELLNAEVSASL